jgi:STE24 endopeptidase
VALGAAIDAGVAAATAVALVALMRRLPRGWWVPASLVVVVGSAGLLYVGPVVLDPLFNRFTPLQGRRGRTCSTSARRSGVEVGEVLVMDASRRTTAANAYVAGLGRTKRVVVYDTLLEFPRAEQRLVLAHELAHQHYRDVPRGLLYVLLVAPAGLLAVAVLTRALGRARRARRRPDAARPGLLGVPRPARHDGGLQPALPAGRGPRGHLRAPAHRRGPPVHRLRAADRAAQREQPRAAGLEPLIFATHPTTLERIGAGVAWARGVRP